MRENEWSRTLILNGTVAQLGTVLDVVDKVHGRHECSIGLIDGDSSYRWTFRGDRTDMFPCLLSVWSSMEKTFDKPDRLRYLLPSENKTSSLSLRLRDLTYITAERLGPREVYNVYDPQVAPVVGSAGEYAVSVLHSRRDEKVWSGGWFCRITQLHYCGKRKHECGSFFPGCGLGHPNRCSTRMR